MKPTTPTSSLRSGGSHPRPSSSSSSFDPLALLAHTASTAPRLDAAPVRPTSDHYGILPDGRVTANHPYVRAYLDGVRRVPNDRDSTPGDDPFGWKPKTKEDRDVYEVLRLEKPLTQRDSDCVFVLAALKVYYDPKHRAHFTFWGKTAGEATAERVQKILDLSPCPVASPIGWMHKDENMWLLEILQASAFPPSQARRRANGMTLRDRRAGAANENTTPPSAPRPKRARTSTANKPAMTPVRQSARLASVTPQTKNLVLPEAADATNEAPPAAPSAVPVLSELPALNTLLTPSSPGSSLTPSPASRTSEVPLPEADDADEVPAPARRSARVPKKRQIFSPESTSQALQAHTEERTNALGLRARSSSSAGHSEETAVSDGSIETAVEMDGVEDTGSLSKKRKRIIEEEEDDQEQEKEKEIDDAGEPEPEEEETTPSATKKRRAPAKSRKTKPAAKKARTAAANARRSVKA